MNGASPTPQAASRMIHNMHAYIRVGARLGAVYVYVYTGLVCTLRMRVPVQVLVPYRTAAGHHGLPIMDRSLIIDGSVIVKLFITKSMLDRSLNACKTFHNGNQCEH